MNTEDKKQLQSAALSFMEYMHKDEPEIKRIKEELLVIRDTVTKQESLLAGLKQDMNVKILALRKLLVPLIPEELRD